MNKKIWCLVRKCHSLTVSPSTQIVMGRIKMYHPAQNPATGKAINMRIRNQIRLHMAFPFSDILCHFFVYRKHYLWDLSIHTIPHSTLPLKLSLEIWVFWSIKSKFLDAKCVKKFSGVEKKLASLLLVQKEREGGGGKFTFTCSLQPDDSWVFKAKLQIS